MQVVVSGSGKEVQDRRVQVAVYMSVPCDRGSLLPWGRPTGGALQ